MWLSSPHSTTVFGSAKTTINVWRHKWAISQHQVASFDSIRLPNSHDLASVAPKSLRAMWSSLPSFGGIDSKSFTEKAHCLLKKGTYWHALFIKNWHKWATRDIWFQLLSSEAQMVRWSFGISLRAIIKAKIFCSSSIWTGLLAETCDKPWRVNVFCLERLLLLLPRNPFLIFRKTTGS